MPFLSYKINQRTLRNLTTQGLHCQVIHFLDNKTRFPPNLSVASIKTNLLGSHSKTFQASILLHIPIRESSIPDPDQYLVLSFTRQKSVLIIYRCSINTYIKKKWKKIYRHCHKTLHSSKKYAATCKCRDVQPANTAQLPPLQSSPFIQPDSTRENRAQIYLLAFDGWGVGVGGFSEN